jgi:hypothetical protein
MKRKVRIEALPKAKTGMQVGYGLYNRLATMGGLSEPKPDNSLSVGNTIGGVPRDEATIEAEGGETVYTDLTGMGIPQHYTISGPRHAQGGVPMDLPDDSFIFSDFNQMKVKDSDVLNYFGKTAKKGGKGKGYTYADIAKQYDINKYLKILKDPNSDDIDKRTAEKMIENFNLKLGALGLHQESTKGFENGVPEISKPYMEKMGITEEELNAQPENSQQIMMRKGGSSCKTLKRKQEGGDEMMVSPEQMMGQPGMIDQMQPQMQQQDPIAQIMPAIEQMMQQGLEPNDIAIELLNMQVPPEIIMDVFVQMGMPEGEAQMAIEAGMSNEQPQQMMDPAMMEGQGMSPDMMQAMDPSMMQVGGQEPGLEDMVAEALQQGANPEDVLKALVQNGVPQEEATQVISYVTQQMQSSQQQMKKGGIKFINENIFKSSYKTGGSIKRYESYGNRLLALQKMYNESGGKLSIPQKLKMHNELQAIFSEYEKEFGLPKGVSTNYGTDVNKAISMAQRLGEDIEFRINEETKNSKPSSTVKKDVQVETNNANSVTNQVEPLFQNVESTSNIPTKASANPTFPKQTKKGNYYGSVTENVFKETVDRNQWFNWDGFDPSNKEDVIRFQEAYNKLIDDYKLKANKVKVDGKIGEQTASINVGYDEEKEKPKVIVPGDNKDKVDNKDEEDPERPDIVYPELQEYKDPVTAEWTTPDIVNLRGAVKDRLSLDAYYPWTQRYSPELAEAVYMDPSRAIAAQAEQANILTQGLGQFVGPQAMSARSSKIQGQGAKAAANIMSDYDQKNVGLANKFGMYNAETANKAQQYNQSKMQDLYDKGVITQQQFDNAKRKANANTRKAFGQGWKNASDMALMNTTSEQYNIDPGTGTVYFTGVDKPVNAQKLSKSYDEKLAEYMAVLGDPKAAVSATNAWQRTQLQKPTYAEGGFVLGANVFPFMFY